MPDRTMPPYRIVILGGDPMGRAIAAKLAADSRYRPVVADTHDEGLRDAEADGLETLHLDGHFRESVGRALAGTTAVVCTETKLNLSDVVTLAQERGCHYIDISENPATAREIAKRATDASCVVPACGLAPGYVTALTGEMLAGCDRQTELEVRVGVLPAHRTNRLGYGKMWSLGGLIAEYTAPCLAIRDGRITELRPLQELEEIALAGEQFEAFTTAGTLDGLIHRYDGQVGNLIFKTLRYPGHLDYVRFLLDDLGLSERLYQLHNLLMNGLPAISEDRVIISMILRRGPGARPEHFLQMISARQDGDGQWQSAVSVATAAHAACVVDIACTGLAPHRGLLDHGELTPGLLRESPFFAPLSTAPAASALPNGTEIHEGQQSLQR
ncbi:MAG: saccharopine dehydrogenase C-terminal domain-containing protein [Oricola sp.]